MTDEAEGIWTPESTPAPNAEAAMIARLRHMAETDADMLSWVSSDILNACETIEELRAELRTRSADGA